MSILVNILIKFVIMIIMGKPMMIQEDDEIKIEALKKKTGAKTKIEVLRRALVLLENEVDRSDFRLG